MCKVPAKGRHLQKNWEKLVWLPQRERRGEVRFQGRQGWFTQPSGNSGNQPEAFQTCDCNKALCQALWRNQRPFKSWGKKWTNEAKADSMEFKPRRQNSLWVG